MLALDVAIKFWDAVEKLAGELAGAAPCRHPERHGDVPLHKASVCQRTG